MSANNLILDDLENRVSQGLQAANPVLTELESLEQEVEAIMMNIYSQWDLEDQNRLRVLRKQLRAKIDDIKATRDPQADALMNQAEAAFYDGKYKDAIQLYEQVLMVKPNWLRAEEHYQLAKEYLQTGNIPEIALPAEAAVLYGKARSAAGVMEFERALAYYEEVKKILQAAGISKFQEGHEFENEVQALIDAHEIYNQGFKAFQAGNLDEALQKIQVAFSASGLALHQDKLVEYRDFQTKLEQIQEKLFQRPINSQLVNEAGAELDALLVKYGSSHPTLEQMQLPIQRAIDNIMYVLRGRINDIKGILGTKEARININEASEILFSLESGWQDGGDISHTLQSFRDELSSLEGKNDTVLKLIKEHEIVINTSSKISELQTVLNIFNQYQESHDNHRLKAVSIQIQSRIKTIQNQRLLQFFIIVGIIAAVVAVFSVVIGNTIAFVASVVLAALGLMAFVVYHVYLK